MSEDQPPSRNGASNAGWLSKLTRALGSAPQDRQSLVDVLQSAHRRGLYDVEAFSMLQGVLEVSEMQVRDIMIPRPHIVVVERDASPEDVLPIIIESGHSRFPAIGEDRDEVVGILLAKDLLRHFSQATPGAADIGKYLRPAVFIPESKRLNVLLKEFRDSHNHMAIVVDEYGGVSGLLTIEDVIEQIVGEIDDEHDIEEDEDIQRESDSRYLVRALTRIDDFNEYFSTDFSDEDYDTIGGLILHELGRLPRRGETLSHGGLEFKILRASRRRVDQLQVTRANEVQVTED